MIPRQKTYNLSIFEKASYLYSRKSGKTKHRCYSVSFIVGYWMDSFERVLPSFLVLASMKRHRQKYVEVVTIRNIQNYMSFILHNFVKL